MTTVRLFAALRAAADDHDHLEVAADTPAALARELGERFGDTMERRLAVATLFVDGRTVTLDDTSTRLDTADEVVLVPPFSGG